MSDILTAAHPEPDSTFRLENPRKLPTTGAFIPSKSKSENANFLSCLSFILRSFSPLLLIQLLVFNWHSVHQRYHHH